MIGNFAATLLLAVATGASALPVITSAVPLPDEGVPIASQAYREDLIESGYENGRLPAELLVALESNPNCLLEEEAAEAWLKLERQAARDGVEFTASWCYRDMKTQRRTYRRNCPWVVVETPNPGTGGQGEPTEPADPTEPANPADDPAVSEPGDDGAGATTPGDDSGGDGEAEEPAKPKRVRVCKVPTARPGNSNHGWGRAIDLTVDGALLTCDSEAFEWLVANAPFYGWVHPEWAACGAAKQEAWHWEWGAVKALKKPAGTHFPD